MERQIFKAVLLTIGILVTQLNSYASDEKSTIHGLFVISKDCRRELTHDSFDEDYATCSVAYPFQLSADLTVAPFVLTANYEASTEKTKASFSAHSTSEGTSKDTKKEEIRQYKQTMLYLVSADAVDFAASPDRIPSVALAKYIETLTGDFPGETVKEINARIIQTHQNVLQYLNISQETL